MKRSQFFKLLFIAPFAGFIKKEAPMPIQGMMAVGYDKANNEIMYEVHNAHNITPLALSMGNIREIAAANAMNKAFLV